MGLDTSFLFKVTDAQPVPAVELHVHTSYTDGRENVRTMIEAAVDAGLSVLGFAEHVNANTTYWHTFAEEVIYLRKVFGYKIQILCGIEAKVKDYSGNLDLPVDPLRDVDYIIGVVHRYPKREGRFYRLADLDGEQAVQLEYRALAGLISSGNCDVIGHIGGTCRMNFQPFPRQLRRKLLGLASDAGAIVEFNARHHPETTEWLEDLRWSGVLVALGSDAHERDQIGKTYNLIRDLL